MNNEITIYRVRKSAGDIKSQKGAFFILQNAITAAVKTKRNVYGNCGECVWEYKAYKRYRKTKQCGFQ